MRVSKLFPTTILALLFVINFLSVSATPCCSLNYERTHEILLTHPAEQEIILVTFSEDGITDDGGEENPVQSDSIADKVALNDKLSGEVVDSAANKENSTIIIKSGDLVASNDTKQLISNTTEALNEDTEHTTEMFKEN